MILAGTGHRPERAGGHSKEAHGWLVSVARAALDREGPSKVISGMALGWDIALAEAALQAGVPLCAAVPFAGQEDIWNDEAKARYREVLARASEVKVVSAGGFASYKYHVRDVWMVENCDKVLALWDGSKKGGTASTVRYAKGAGRPIINVWEEYLKGPGATVLS